MEHIILAYSGINVRHIKTSTSYSLKKIVNSIVVRDMVLEKHDSAKLGLPVGVTPTGNPIFQKLKDALIMFSVHIQALV